MSIGERRGSSTPSPTDTGPAARVGRQAEKRAPEDARGGVSPIDRMSRNRGPRVLPLILPPWGGFPSPGQPGGRMMARPAASRLASQRERIDPDEGGRA